ncbi:MAG: hypothetical protein RL318_3034, partial [Fibrobacterota bacterium]
LPAPKRHKPPIRGQSQRALVRGDLRDPSTMAEVDVVDVPALVMAQS